MSSADRAELGRSGEELAARLLERRGWKIVGRNVRVRYGELDIVAMDKDEMVFVEVRLRTVGLMMPPEASVGPAKIKKLIRAARRYVEAARYDGNWRIDVVAITVDRDGTPSAEIFSDITMGMEVGR